MRRILLELSYKGTNYKGFQKQKNTNQTIEQYLESALNKVFCEDIKVTASGRTDAGVHAIKQFVHFDTTKTIKIDKVPTAINTYLPQDIKVLSAKEVDNNINARFSAKKKTYMYVYSTKKITSPLVWDMVSPLEYDIDENLAKMTIKKIIGTHNFKAFSSANTDIKDYTRTIYDFVLEKKDDYLIFKITGNGFLYNMVRIIVGTIIDISRGKLPLDTIENMFITGDRTLGGRTAKPNGLYLYNVEYL